MYWPVKAIIYSPVITAEQKAEVSRAGKGYPISHATMVACAHALRTVDGRTSLVIMPNEDTLGRRVYLHEPSNEEWAGLERSGFYDNNEGFGFFIDALH